MADDKRPQSSLGESHEDHELIPDAAPDAVEELNPADSHREADYGGDGQHLPGGRYNQLNANAPRRLDLDEQVDSALNKDEK